ncbi:uncharacterized protein FOMMEDRAFT_153953 [Fomitiporia mediterranea MF3/22]|uniref:uncharacterized protein n=1 Tax=Fomitiporia mediterranea (strain MF3/22) TaxID=694068 RepID=UPI00044074B9|nr:uncharacterized protein FOMMEDRAFT_153953 [Fomitiporia mediterranea MF3/22]EJD04827.1 hypothetical protein FOMMEDRAFT_153953 [Fomitiporia mediterranea MF3/22]
MANGHGHSNGSNREYELIVRQEPKQARMCGVGTKADRRPIDPPPVVQLRVIDKGSRSRRSSSPDDRAHYNQSFLQNPYYFMYASLASPDRDEELHLLKDGKTRCTTGSVVSSLYHLKDPEADTCPAFNGGKEEDTLDSRFLLWRLNASSSWVAGELTVYERGQGRDAGFFVFPDLSVRTEGTYRLKLTLFEVIGANVHHCKSIFSAAFYVYTAKKFPGMEESTNLSCALADQGIKIRIRKDVRIRKRPVDPNWFQPVQRDDASDASDDEGARDPKRQRNEAGPPPPPPAAPMPAAGSSGGTWGTIDPSLPPTAAPPPPAPAPDSTPYDPRAFNPAPAPSAAPAAPGNGHPEYHPPQPQPQPHQHAPYMPPPPHPSGMYAGAYGWGPVPPPPPHLHAPGYGAYPGYDHHRAQPYGAPAMHYGVPPPYGYYDQHGQYVHPPPQPQQPPQQQQSPQGESPRSAGAQSAGQSQQAASQQGRKDSYPPPSASTPGMIPPPTGYATQDYAYGRPPPATSSTAPSQARPYHPSPAPPPQSAPGASGSVPSAYSTQSQGHMGHYLPPHQHAPYGYAQGGDAYSQQPQQPQHPAQQQQQQWGPYAPSPFGAYGRPGWGAPPPGAGAGDPYAYAGSSQAGGAGGGYVRPGPEDGGRRSPPVPSISSQGRTFATSAGSPQRASANGNGSASAVAGMGAGASPDRIQLAPLRQGGGGGGAAEQTYGALGKKNPLSIGSIISDES